MEPPMKRHLFAAAAIMLFFAQTLTAQEQFFLGATAGASSTHFSGDIPENGSYTSKTGFNAGLTAEYALSKDIRISLQPSYVRRGTGVAYDVGETELRDSLQVSLDYFSIPVIARFLTPGGFWFVNGGLDLAFLLDASRKDVTTGSTADVRHLLNDVDLSMLFGVGKTFQLEPVSLSLELRYGQSLLNAGANDELAAKLGMSPRFRSSGFQLLFAVLYPM
jgi:hypothetical protein